MINGRPQQTFSSSLVYHSLLEPLPSVPWYPLIWIKKGIPKHKSQAWLMQLNRCPTRDRLLAWNLKTDPSCLLSRDHIYFNCSFSIRVWYHFSSRLALTWASPSWDDIAHTLLVANWLSLSILTWQAVIYNLWWERNERLHRGIHRSPDQIVAKTSTIIKNRISAMRLFDAVLVLSFPVILFSVQLSMVLV